MWQTVIYQVNPANGNQQVVIKVASSTHKGLWNGMILELKHPANDISVKWKRGKAWFRIK